MAYEKFFIIGGTWIAVMQGDSELDRSYNHIAFKVPEADLDIYRKKVEASGLEPVDGRNRIEGESRSFYFYDYDNHLFELHTGFLSERLSSYQDKLRR